MAPHETIEDALTRVLQAVSPGDAESLEGVRLLAVYSQMISHPVPVVAAVGRSAFAKLLVVLREHPGARTLPDIAWLEGRLGGVAQEVQRHWPFLVSVVLPSFERFVAEPDAGREEVALKEWAAVQLVAAPGRVGEEVAFAIASETFGTEQGQRAVDEARDKRERRAGTGNAGRVRRSAFYAPAGDLAKGIAYARRALSGQKRDARVLDAFPHFPPSTHRRLRQEHQRQAHGIDPKDAELFPLLDEYFAPQAPTPQAGAVSNDAAAFHRGDEPEIALFSRRDELAEQIRAILARRRAHGTTGDYGLRDLAMACGAKTKAEISAVKEALRRLVVRLRTTGRLPARLGGSREAFDQKQAQVIVTAYKRSRRA
jgi:hypothetical protein